MSKIFELAKSIELRKQVAEQQNNDADKAYILSDECVERLSKLETGESTLSYPEKKVVFKNKARDVYCYQNEDILALKLIGAALHSYDNCLDPALFSWRKDAGISNLLLKFRGIKNRQEYYILRGDIKSFEPSIEEDVVAPIIKDFFKDDEPIRNLFLNYMSERHYYYRGVLYNDAPCAKTGCILNNIIDSVIIQDLDKYVRNHSVFYSRFFDDILVLCKTREEIENMYKYIKEHLEAKKLRYNVDKTKIYNPGETFEFLGMSVDKDVNIGPAYIKTCKQFIHDNKIHVLYLKRRMNLCNASALEAFIKIVKQKLYPDIYSYFPYITSVKSLKTIDHVVQDAIRQIGMETNTDSKYYVRHEDMLEFGYESLVHQYYRFMKKWYKKEIKYIKKPN